MSVLNKNFLNSFFLFKERHSSFGQEMMAGLTTFSTLAYLILLVPKTQAAAGIPFGSSLTAILLVSAFSTILMGLWANYPFALAPGIALSAYTVYSVILGEGIEWQNALTMVFAVGALFFFLNLLKIRQLIILAIPPPLRIATTAGLGLFLAFIGLRNGEIVVDHPMTLVSFGTPSLELGLIALGFIVTVLLMKWRVNGAFFFGILLIWGLALALGLTKWEGFFAWPESIESTFFKMNFEGFWSPKVLEILFTFIFVSLFDTSGTLVGLASQANLLDKEGHLPRINKAVMPDAVGSMAAGLCGSTTIAVYLESASGIASGGKTGLTACVVGLLFLFSLFLGPFISSVPLFATVPALLIIGGLMLQQITHLNFREMTEWIPGFVTFILIPLTYSVAIGIGVGFILYSVLMLLSGKIKDVHPVTWVISLFFIIKLTIL